MAWSGGDEAALGRLMPLVYDELNRIARTAMRNETKGHTLQPADLVHETYLKLVGQHGGTWEHRSKFFCVAARMMRRILVDHARGRVAAKRGGHKQPVSLASVAQPAEPGLDLLDLNAALDRLALVDPLQSQLVEMRYFVGMNIEETADALSISPSTAKREWAIARDWLHHELS